MKESLPAKAPEKEIQLTAMEKAIAMNDLASLTAEQRMSYFKAVCDSVGLNPLTKPFDFILFQGKLVLYANKGCAEQLRDIHNISVEIVSREMVDTLLVVTARATKGNRRDESIAAIDIANCRGESKANAMMKAETKAKRRVTLSICGLGMPDESEVQTLIPSTESPADRLNALALKSEAKPLPDVEVQPEASTEPADEPVATKAWRIIDWLQKKKGVTNEKIEAWAKKNAGSRIPDDFTEADYEKLLKHASEIKDDGVAPEQYF